LCAASTEQRKGRGEGRSRGEKKEKDATKPDAEHTKKEKPTPRNSQRRWLPSTRLCPN
jgi:hypothetical protein